MAVTPRAKGLLRLLVLVALLLAGVYALRGTHARDWVTPAGAARLVAALRAPWWAPPAFVVAYTVAAALDFSGLVFTLVGGAVFGFWWGSLLNLIGANLGASAAFWVARLLGREGLQAVLGGRLSGIDRLAQHAGFAWLLRLRLIPVIPFNLINFASGLTAIPWRTYAAATALGIVPGTLVYTFFADALLSGSHAAGHRALIRVLIAGALLVLLSFVPAIARRLGFSVRPSDSPTVRP
ncbi:MAG TPA: TVP38/TMEM64 family protein [Gemmatimonadales bacterium]|nr:TVP38/TMEM64 family protein [Gemmatimonadales bacterium]